MSQPHLQPPSVLQLCFVLPPQQQPSAAGVWAVFRISYGRIYPARRWRGFVFECRPSHWDPGCPLSLHSSNQPDAQRGMKKQALQLHSAAITSRSMRGGRGVRCGCFRFVIIIMLYISRETFAKKQPVQIGCVCMCCSCFHTVRHYSFTTKTGRRRWWSVLDDRLNSFFFSPFLTFQTHSQARPGPWLLIVWLFQ